MAVQVPYPCASPYDGQEHGFPASACQSEVEGVDSETSWNKEVEVEVADEGCFAHSQESRDEMEGGCEGLGEYPSGRNLSVPWDPCRHSLGHTSEMGEAQGGAE